MQPFPIIFASTASIYLTASHHHLILCKGNCLAIPGFFVGFYLTGADLGSSVGGVRD
jgi:hypothetical protein